MRQRRPAAGKLLHIPHRSTHCDMNSLKPFPALALAGTFLAAATAGSASAARMPTDKADLTQEIYVRCLYELGEFGNDALQACMATDQAAAEKLISMPPEAQPIVDRCFTARWQQGYGSVLACVEKDAAANAALAAYAREHQLLIQGCRQGVGQQGAAKVKECVDAVLAQPAQGK